MVPELEVLLSNRSLRLNCFNCIYSLKRGFTVVRYEPYYSPKGDFIVVRYEPNCSLKRDFTVVRYEPNCSHSWNLTKGRFHCGRFHFSLKVDFVRVKQCLSSKGEG